MCAGGFVSPAVCVIRRSLAEPGQVARIGLTESSGPFGGGPSGCRGRGCSGCAECSPGRGGNRCLTDAIRSAAICGFGTAWPRRLARTIRFARQPQHKFSRPQHGALMPAEPATRKSADRSPANVPLRYFCFSVFESAGLLGGYDLVACAFRRNGLHNFGANIWQVDGSARAAARTAFAICGPSLLATGRAVRQRPLITMLNIGFPAGVCG